VVHGCDAQIDHDYRMTKLAIKIRNELRCPVLCQRS